MRDPLPVLASERFPAITRAALTTLQVNLGYKCNQSCLHCHVAAGPNRKEIMDSANIDTVLTFIDRVPLETLDLTGGAPELNPGFRALVEAGSQRGIDVIDRCNLTILGEPGQADLAQFLADQRVHVIASLPCYSDANVDQQRGDGVFKRSIDGLRKLNALGYARPGSGLTLDLVFNPQGTSLPPPQAALESDYKRELGARFGVEFNSLLTLANVPVGRFGSMLASRGELPGYLSFLKDAYSEDNLDGVMCRTLVSVDWQGYVYDCDFNQMLDLPMRAVAGGEPDGQRTHLSDLLTSQLAGQAIVTRGHCYACTAGQGSSCGGALS